MMKWKLSSAKSSKLVYHFVKFIGLAPFTLNDEKFDLPTFLGLFYSVTMAVIHLLFVTMSIVIPVIQIEKKPFQQTIKIWGLIQHVACSPATSAIIVIIILSRKNIIHLMNELCNMSHKLECLGIGEHHGEFFTDVFVTTAVANAIIVAMCILTGVLEHTWHIVNSIQYGIACWFNFNALLIYVQLMYCIEKRFKLLNERLSNKFVEPHDGSAHDLEVLTSGRPQANDEVGNEGLTQSELIRRTETLHSELSNLVNRVSDVFAIPILLNSFQFFCVIVLSGRWIYSLVQFSPSSSSSAEFLSFGVFGIWCPLLRITIVIGEMVMIAHSSTATCERGNATRAMIIEVWNEFKPGELEDDFFMFSIQLLDQPVAVSVFGIFDLDYSYVYKICGSAISYVIAAVQLGEEKLNPYVSFKHTSI